MGILAWIVFGFLAGLVATLIYGNNGRVGWLGNIILGIVGAFVGGWIVTLFGSAGVTGFNFHSFLVAVVGSIVVLFVANLGGNRI